MLLNLINYVIILFKNNKAMNSLFDLCLKSIIDNDLHINTLPYELIKKIDQQKLHHICGQTVKTIRCIEEKREPVGMFGFTQGIQSVIQSKILVSSLARLFEKHRRSGKDGIGVLKCQLILFYLKQEHDFYDWYVPHDTRYSSMIPNVGFQDIKIPDT